MIRAIMTDNSLIHAVAQAAVESLPSRHSRRVYTRHITSYLSFLSSSPTTYLLPTYSSSPSSSTTNTTTNTHEVGLPRHDYPPAFARGSVLSWLTQVREQSGQASANQALAAVKKLATECAERGLMDRATLAGIESIGTKRAQGVRIGLWLTLEQAQQMLDLPTGPTRTRDRALLALLIGCGLRREELALLTWDKFTRRWERWVLADIRGKGGRTRSVAVPQWAACRLSDWQRESWSTVATNSRGSRIFPLTPSGIWHAVTRYGSILGLPVAPHDLRRTFAALSRSGGADIRVIQEELGHSSVATTERYLGRIQGLGQGTAAGDHIDLK